MSGPDPSDRWTNVLAWLRIAAPDERAARICLAAEPPLPDVAAYRCQQAGEKILKGFLVLADTDFRSTPDLDELGRSVMLRFPDVAALVAPIGAWTVWGVEHRYPSETGSIAEPSADVLSAALDAIARPAGILRSPGAPRAVPNGDDGPGAT